MVRTLMIQTAIRSTAYAALLALAVVLIESHALATYIIPTTSTSPLSGPFTATISSSNSNFALSNATVGYNYRVNISGVGGFNVPLTYAAGAQNLAVSISNTNVNTTANGTLN